MTHPTVEILSTQDATLWWVQGLDTPLHIGALAFFDGGPLREPDGRIRIDAIRARIGAQLEHTPRVRQRLVELPLGQGLADLTLGGRTREQVHDRAEGVSQNGTPGCTLLQPVARSECPVGNNSRRIVNSTSVW